jgi:hypothetical protein
VADFEPVFTALRRLLESHASRLFVKTDEPGNYYLETVSFSNKGKRMFFGAVQIKKSYVSFHLMPLYGCPDLVKGMSPELKKRMQGKSCLNFTRVDQILFGELGRITDAGFQKFQKYL